MTQIYRNPAVHRKPDRTPPTEKITTTRRQHRDFETQAATQQTR